MLFIIGLCGFFALHALPFMPEQRERLVQLAGSEGLYKLIFSLASLLCLILAGLGKGLFPFVELWPTPTFLRYLSLIAMYVAFIFMVARVLPTNLKRYVRHPLLVGIIIWAATHIITNGDIGSLILFLSFLAYSIVAIRMTDLRTDTERPEPKVYPLEKDLILVGIASGIYLFFLVSHGLLFGRSIFL